MTSQRPGFAGDRRHPGTGFTLLAIINHDWWLPRTFNGDPRRLSQAPGVAGTITRTKDGWPRSLTDPVAAFQPVIIDLARASGGHRVGKGIRSVNRATADGHVETVRDKQIRWQLSGNWTSFY